MKDRSDDPSSILTTHCRRFYQGNYDYEFADEPRRNQVNIRWGEGADIFFKWMRERERERNFLFNDALNTFYLRLYGVRHMVKDHSDSEKGNPLPPHRLLLSINSKGSFICTIPQTG